MKSYFQLLSKTYARWIKNEPFQQSAVIAYYTLFSLPSLLVIIITVAGYFFGKSAVQSQIIHKLGGIVGQSTATTIEKLITNVSFHNESTIALVVSIAVLIFGATGAFFQLKIMMNKIWGVREKKDNILMVVLDRVISLGMVLAIGVLMVASFIVTTVVTTLGNYISQYAPSISSEALNIFNFLFSYIFIGVLFTIIFKLLPDIKVRWKITFIGASVTTVLFLIAEYALSFYLAQSNPTSVFGGASSIILIMVWIYYFCLILFFGAEFTVQYALYKGEKVIPNRFSEPAYIQQLKELKEQKADLRAQKHLLQELAERANADD